MPPKYPSYKQYTASPFCKTCGGQCCQRYSGIYHPADFNLVLTYETLTALLEKNVCIDWYGGTRKIYFLRPTHQGMPVKINPSFGGVCIHWTKTGCKLPFPRRPLQCRILKPKLEPDQLCVGTVSKRQAALWWSPYQSILKKIIRENPHWLKDIAKNMLTQLTETIKQRIGENADRLKELEKESKTMTIQEYVNLYRKLDPARELNSDEIYEGGHYAISISRILTVECLDALRVAFKRIVALAPTIHFMDKNLFVAHIQNYLLAKCLEREINDTKLKELRIKEKQPPVNPCQILERSELPAILVIHNLDKDCLVSEN